MPLIRSEFSCPTCKATTGRLVQIVANAGELSCENNHRWNDTQSFMSLGPTMDFKPTLLKAQQNGHVPMNITVPLSLKNNAETKFGEKLSRTVTQILEMLVEGDVMIVGQTDLDRLKERLGQPFANSSELVGVVYAKMCEVDEAKQERESAVQDLKAYEDRSPGRVIVNLGDQFQTAVGKAKDAEMPLKLWIERALTNGISENWF